MKDNENASSWMNPKLETKDTVEYGRGVFTRELIKKDEIVIIQGGKIVSYSNLCDGSYDDYLYHCYQVERDFYICPFELTEKSLDGVFVVNHSCNPNCGFANQITLRAMRDINIDEQITYDYAMTDVGSIEEDWISMECNCGSDHCRKLINFDDWKLKELQDRYKGYFSPYVQRLIESDYNVLE